MQKDFRTGLFMFENKENGESVHGIVLNNPEVNGDNYQDRVLLCTPIGFMYSYKTSLNYVYAIDITETSMARLYMETYAVYKEYTANLLAAQEILRDTGNVTRAIAKLLPTYEDKVSYTENENGSHTVWMDSSIVDIDKSSLNNGNDYKRRVVYLNLFPDGTWDEIKTPKDYLDDIAVDKDCNELVDMLYSLVSDTMGENLSDFKNFMNRMDLEAYLPKTNIDKENGAIVRVENGNADLMLDESYRVRVKYHEVPNKKSFIREPRAFMLWNGGGLNIKKPR